jgi:hypothetical protein
MSKLFTKITVQDADQHKERLSSVWSTAKIDAYFEQYSKGEKLGPPPFIDGDIGKKAPNLPFQYTPEEIEEFRKCANDVVYFADRYASAMTDEGIKKITLRDYQVRVIDGFQKNRYVALLSSRQTGKTITSAIYITWYICFHVDRNALVLANKGATAKEIMEKIKDVYDRLPYFLKPGIVVNNVQTMYFDNGCKIFAETTTKSSGRGKTVHLLYADEFAFIPDNIAEAFYTSIYPTLSSSKVSQVIITSTPNGPNLFYDLYMGGVNGTNEYKSLRVDYWEVPGRDEAWKQKEIKNLGINGAEKFDTEYGLKFFTGSKMLLSEEQIERLKRGQKAYEWREIPEIHDLSINHDGLVWDPDFDFDFGDKKFVVSVDLADGNGRDSTVFNIFQLKICGTKELETVKSPTQESDFFYLDQIAVFKDNKVSIENAARIFAEVLVNYLGVDNTKAVVEINFKGDYFISRVLNDPKYMDDVYEDVFVHTRHTKDSKKKKPGVRIKRDNKNLFCTTFKRLEHMRKVRVYEQRTCEELINFQKTESSYAAESTQHDDIAMTCVNLCPYLIEFDIDGQPAGEDFLLQVEEMFDGIEDAVKTKIQESIYSTLDTQDDDDISTMVGFNLFDSEFRPDPPPNLNFVL